MPSELHLESESLRQITLAQKNLKVKIQETSTIKDLTSVTNGPGKVETPWPLQKMSKLQHF